MDLMIPEPVSQNYIHKLSPLMPTCKLFLSELTSQFKISKNRNWRKPMLLLEIICCYSCFILCIH